MAYVKMPHQLIHIDSLAQECGLFTSKTNQNGGYGCKSRSKEKQEPGCCYVFDCPLAHPADIEDLREYDNDLYEQYKNGDEITDWVIQHSELPKQEARNGNDWRSDERDTDTI